MSTINRRQALIAGSAMVLTSAAGALARPKMQTTEFGPKISLPEIFPDRFTAWSIDTSIVPLQPSAQLQKVIDETYDQTLARTYRNTDGYRIMLSVAYGGRQVEGMNTHRPEVCYPAQGMSVRKSTWRDEIDLQPGTLPIRRLVTGNGPRNEPISYWLVVGRHITDFGLPHKIATLKYGLTGRIPDGMLVRVSSIDDDEPRSFEQQDVFLRQMMAAVSPTHRKHLLGVVA